MSARFRGTTVVAVARDGKTAVAGDGQVSVGATIMKARAEKVRRLHGGAILAGFSGASADAMALLTRFEAKLEEYRGNLARSAVELSREWRLDRSLRRLEALLIVADQSRMLLLSGTGDVVEPDDGVLAIGSGGPYALAAARALRQHTQLTAREIAVTALGIAASICVYTNDRVTVEEL